MSKTGAARRLGLFLVLSCLLAPSDAARCTVCPGETTMEACETNILVVCPSGYTCCRQTKRCGSGPCFVKECVNNPQACH